MRILVVEDDSLLGDAIKAGLAQAGFSVDWVKDGVAAELTLRTHTHAAVVLDLGLPRVAGSDVLRRMRADGDKTPVLILTARDAISDRIKGLDSGADDYMVKPFDLHELAARLRALIRRSANCSRVRTLPALSINAWSSAYSRAGSSRGLFSKVTWRAAASSSTSPTRSTGAGSPAERRINARSRAASSCRSKGLTM